ncbi:hypothetical protein AAG602_11610 [Citromicrobium bathyomarinum]
MRPVPRPADVPEILKTKGAEERKKAARYFGPPRASAKAFPFAIYKHKEVKNELERLFRGKCAYCETFYASAQSMDVEHYRPKGAVEGDDAHPGYWWIAMAWDNLLPSCIDCNRKRYQITPTGDVSQVRLHEATLGFSRSSTVGTGKKDSFPLAAGGVRATRADDPLSAEKPLLLNPCEEDPGEHLEYLFDPANPVSFVVARKLVGGDPDFAGDHSLSLKGATSIHVYGLNRIGLVQARTEVLRRLEFLGALMIDLKALAQDLAGAPPDETVRRAERAVSGFADRLLVEMRAMADPARPYSAMVAAWLDHFASRVADPDGA